MFILHICYTIKTINPIVWKIECSILKLVDFHMSFFVDCVYRNFFGQLVKTRRRLELLLEDLPCDYDTEEYCETSDQLLEPLLLCHQSLVSPLL